MDEQQTESRPCEQKLAFATRKEAQTTATVAAYRYGSKVKPYHCAHCDLWHLSTDYDD
jgi:hypothetical protein